MVTRNVLSDELAAQWHPTLNNGLLSEQFTGGSRKKVWWICDKGHEWKARIGHRSNGVGCPICTNQKIIIGFNDLQTTNPKLAAQWNPTKNGDFRSEQFSLKSGKKVWWECEKGHEWEAAIGDRSKGSGCPICSGHKVLIGFNDLQTTNPKLVAQWHPILNGDLKPEQFTTGSNKKNLVDR